MEILEKIFGDIGKIKVMKLFVFNANTHFDIESVFRKTKIKNTEAKRIMAIFEKIGLVKRKDIKNAKGKKIAMWHLNHSFSHLNAFKNFFLEVSPFTSDEIVKKLSRAGRLKLVAVSGVFLHSEESVVDLLIAGDRLKRSSLNRVIKEIESGLGKEIKYAVLDTEDFNYRLSSRDKLIRDVFDYPHTLILDKVGVQV